MVLRCAALRFLKQLFIEGIKINNEIIDVAYRSNFSLIESSITQNRNAKTFLFYIIFISGWDDLMLNALDGLENLEKLETNKSRKQIDRFVNFYKVK